MVAVKNGEEIYEREEQVGTGAIGEVYRARSTATGERVSLKLLHAHCCDDPGFPAQFRDQMRAAQRIVSDNVQRVRDYGRWDEQRYYVASEYVEGKSLRAYLAAKKRLDPLAALVVSMQVASGVEAGHAEGVVHGDLKPENVVIDSEGKARVGDFGIAMALEPGVVRMAGAGAAAVSAQYMAPEQVQAEPSTPAADVYALGIMLYEMLAGAPPFSAYNALGTALKHVNEAPHPLREAVPSVPPAVEAIVTKAIAKRSEQRYKNAGQMLTALHEAHGRLQDATARKKRSTVVAAPVSRRSLGIKVGAAALVLVLGAGALAIAAQGGGGGSHKAGDVLPASADTGSNGAGAAVSTTTSPARSGSSQTGAASSSGSSGSSDASNASGNGSSSSGSSSSGSSGSGSATGTTSNGSGTATSGLGTSGGLLVPTPIQQQVYQLPLVPAPYQPVPQQPIYLPPTPQPQQPRSTVPVVPSPAAVAPTAVPPSAPTAASLP